MNAHFSINIKINGFQEDHRYLETQMLCAKNKRYFRTSIFKDLFINLSENDNGTNEQMYYLPA